MNLKIIKKLLLLSALSLTVGYAQDYDEEDLVLECHEGMGLGLHVYDVYLQSNNLYTLVFGQWKVSLFDTDYDKKKCLPHLPILVPELFAMDKGS